MDRSIANPEIFVQTNVMGTVNLLQRAKEAWYDPQKKTWKEGKKYLQVSTDEVYGALGPEGFFISWTEASAGGVRATMPLRCIKQSGMQRQKTCRKQKQTPGLF